MKPMCQPNKEEVSSKCFPSSPIYRETAVPLLLFWFLSVKNMCLVLMQSRHVLVSVNSLLMDSVLTTEYQVSYNDTVI